MFTFVLGDAHGSTIVSQVTADSLEAAVDKWVNTLADSQPWLPSRRKSFLQNMKEIPVLPVENLKDVWRVNFTMCGKSLMTYIIG